MAAVATQNFKLLTEDYPLRQVVVFVFSLTSTSVICRFLRTVSIIVSAAIVGSSIEFLRVIYEEVLFLLSLRRQHLYFPNHLFLSLQLHHHLAM